MWLHTIQGFYTKTLFLQEKHKSLLPAPLHPLLVLCFKTADVFPLGFLPSLNISKIASELYLSSYTTLLFFCVAGCLQRFHSTPSLKTPLIDRHLRTCRWDPAELFAHQFFEKYPAVTFYLCHVTERSKHQYASVGKGLIPARRSYRDWLYFLSLSPQQCGITLGCSGFCREAERRWRGLNPQRFDRSLSKGRAALCCTRREFRTALTAAPSVWQMRGWSSERWSSVIQLSAHGCDSDRLEIKRFLGSGLMV